MTLSNEELVSQLNWRYSTKAFDPARKLSDNDFESLLESLRLSASSFGLQPWKFVVVKDPAVRALLHPHSWNQPQVVDASHLIVLCRLKEMPVSHIDTFVESIAATRKAPVASLDGYKQMMVGFTKRQTPEQQAAWMESQVYIALGTLLTAAAVRGIDACPMEGFIRAKYDEILGLGALGLASVVVCPVGYRSATDRNAQLAKVRFARKDVVVEI